MLLEIEVYSNFALTFHLGSTRKPILLWKFFLSDYFLCWCIKLFYLTSSVSAFPTFSSFIISEPNFHLNNALCWIYCDLSHLRTFACIGAFPWNAALTLHPANSCSFSKTSFTYPLLHEASEILDLWDSTCSCLCLLRILIT